MSEVPLARQCTMPGCSREKVDPTEHGGLCADHSVEVKEMAGSRHSYTGSDDENTGTITPEEDETEVGNEVLDAVDDAVEFFHAQLDREVEFPHSDAATPREYLREERGLSDDTIDEKRLGWAPVNTTTLLDALMAKGYDREAILGTGLFYEGFTPHFRGRLVLPYFDVDDRPVYAISRSVDLEADPKSGQKYTKAVKTKDYSAVDEPIYGLETLQDGEPVIVTEGIVDAIKAHAAGYTCVSPVTTSFKGEAWEELLAAFDTHDVPRVYILQDAEYPSSDLVEGKGGWGALSLSQLGEGLDGAIRTARHLVDDVDVYIAELPHPGAAKIDVDDYLTEWSDTLDPVLASAKPAEQHPAYNVRDQSLEAAREQAEAAERRSGDGESALFDLRFTDVAPVSEGYRGPNPLGHHGDSENYFVLVGDGEVGYDHKYPTAYNAITYLLVEAGERRADSPNGPLDDEELLAAWVHAKREGHLGGDDPIPHAALRHLAVDRGLCDRDDLADGWRIPRAAYNKALDLVEDEYGVVPGRDSISAGGTGGDPVSALPLSQLATLNRDERSRAAKKRGLEWPTTSEARERLGNRIMTAMRHGEDVVIDAPTALGKSYTVASESWLDRANTTGEAPVVHFSETREARDDAAATSRNCDLSTAVLKGRRERCPVAAGDHDPASDEDVEEPDVVVTMNGVPASAWFDAVCDGRSVPFSTAHNYLHEHNDQGVELPCSEGDHECPAISQWKGVPRDEETGETTADVVHATHQFAHVPGLIRNCNAIFDERPDFTLDLTNDRIQRAVAAFLKEAGAPISTWEAFVQLAQVTGTGGDAVAERDATQKKLQHTPDREWYLENTDAHTVAPALARGVWYALRDDPDENGRRATTVPHEPPRLDGQAHDNDGWNRVWVSLVLDEDNRVRTIRGAPDLSLARCVIGLDAHPATPLWQRNAKPSITVDKLLDAEERRLWRRFERGLQVVQVGDATRPLASGEYFNERGTRAVLEHLREQYSDAFRTTITASSVEGRTRKLMEEIGIDDAETMHYGEEKSRNDFGDEEVGFVNGSIDPGDDYVLNLLAECDLDARPQTVETDEGEERRAHGREFVGTDADTAAAILASVRENHVAQAAGRYARNADDPDNTATVFVRTDAVPVGFADYKVGGVEWVATDTQRRIVEELRNQPYATATELADAAECSKRHVAKTLKRLVENDRVTAREGCGVDGATRFATAGDGAPDLVDLGTEEIANPPVWGSYTWSFAIAPSFSREQRPSIRSSPESSVLLEDSSPG